MTTVMYQDEQEVLSAVKYQPAISIIMPFEPKMSLKTELEHKLKLACQRVHKQLKANYTEERRGFVMNKLQSVIKNLDFSTYKRSIAIFVSPLVEKVFYLDIAVEEKVIIDESFEIRDLVYSKKEINKYLVLVLSAERSTIFLGNTTQFVRILSNMPSHSAGYKHDEHERPGNFS